MSPASLHAVPFFRLDLRPSLSLGVELHRAQELPILLLLPYHALHSHAQHIHVLAALRAEQQGQAGADTAHCGNGLNGAHFYPGDSYFRPHGLSHGAGFAGTHDQRASDGEVQGRLQPLLERLLEQLLLHSMRSTIPIVSFIEQPD